MFAATRQTLIGFPCRLANAFGSNWVSLPEGMPGYILRLHLRRELRTSFAAKALLREAVEQLPEDASVEDAMDRLYFLAKVARGLDAADRGDVVSHEEARQAILGDRTSDAR